MHTHTHTHTHTCAHTHTHSLPLSLRACQIGQEDFIILQSDLCWPWQVHPPATTQSIQLTVQCVCVCVRVWWLTWAAEAMMWMSKWWAEVSKAHSLLPLLTISQTPCYCLFLSVTHTPTHRHFLFFFFFFFCISLSAASDSAFHCCFLKMSLSDGCVGQSQTCRTHEGVCECTAARQQHFNILPSKHFLLNFSTFSFHGTT